MHVSVLDISSILGLMALTVLSFNFLLGLLLGAPYKKSVVWKKLPSKIQAVSILKVHNQTAYYALAFIFLHPFILLFDKATKFQWQNILIPFNAPHQSTFVALGVISFYGFLLVIITTQKPIKRKLGFRRWKFIHMLSYITILMVSIHGMFLDPELKDRQPDFFDCEKLICEACLLVMIIFSVIRTRFYLKTQSKSLSNKKAVF